MVPRAGSLANLLTSELPTMVNRAMVMGARGNADGARDIINELDSLAEDNRPALETIASYQGEDQRRLQLRDAAYSLLSGEYKTTADGKSGVTLAALADPAVNPMVDQYKREQAIKGGVSSLEAELLNDPDTSDGAQRRADAAKLSRMKMEYRMAAWLAGGSASQKGDQVTSAQEISQARQEHQDYLEMLKYAKQNDELVGGVDNSDKIMNAAVALGGNVTNQKAMYDTMATLMDGDMTTAGATKAVNRLDKYWDAFRTPSVQPVASGIPTQEYPVTEGDRELFGSMMSAANQLYKAYAQGTDGSGSDLQQVLDVAFSQENIDFIKEAEADGYFTGLSEDDKANLIVSSLGRSMQIAFPQASAFYNFGEGTDPLSVGMTASAQAKSMLTANFYTPGEGEEGQDESLDGLIQSAAPGAELATFGEAMSDTVAGMIPLLARSGKFRSSQEIVNALFTDEVWRGRMSDALSRSQGLDRTTTDALVKSVGLQVQANPDQPIDWGEVSNAATSLSPEADVGKGLDRPMFDRLTELGSKSFLTDSDKEELAAITSEMSGIPANQEMESFDTGVLRGEDAGTITAQQLFYDLHNASRQFEVESGLTGKTALDIATAYGNTLATMAKDTASIEIETKNEEGETVRETDPDKYYKAFTETFGNTTLIRGVDGNFTGKELLEVLNQTGELNDFAMLIELGRTEGWDKIADSFVSTVKDTYLATQTPNTTRQVDLLEKVFFAAFNRDANVAILEGRARLSGAEMTELKNALSATAGAMRERFNVARSELKKNPGDRIQHNTISMGYGSVSDSPGQALKLALNDQRYSDPGGSAKLFKLLAVSAVGDEAAKSFNAYHTAEAITNMIRQVRVKARYDRNRAASGYKDKADTTLLVADLVVPLGGGKAVAGYKGVVKVAPKLKPALARILSGVASNPGQAVKNIPGAITRFGGRVASPFRWGNLGRTTWNATRWTFTTGVEALPAGVDVYNLKGNAKEYASAGAGLDSMSFGESQLFLPEAVDARGFSWGRVGASTGAGAAAGAVTAGAISSPAGGAGAPVGAFIGGILGFAYGAGTELASYLIEKDWDEVEAKQVYAGVTQLLQQQLNNVDVPREDREFLETVLSEAESQADRMKATPVERMKLVLEAAVRYQTYATGTHKQDADAIRLATNEALFGEYYRNREEYRTRLISLSQPVSGYSRNGVCSSVSEANRVRMSLSGRYRADNQAASNAAIKVGVSMAVASSPTRLTPDQRAALLHIGSGLSKKWNKMRANGEPVPVDQARFIAENIKDVAERYASVNLQAEQQINESKSALRMREFNARKALEQKQWNQRAATRQKNAIELMERREELSM